MKQGDAVILTIEKFGGIATLGQLYQEVLKVKDCEWKTKTPFASMRRIVQTNSEIYKIKPGLYALKKYKTKFDNEGIIVETEKNKSVEEVITFNHSYYQGLLIHIGNLKNYLTYIPNQDKNRKFLNTELAKIRTLQKLPEYSFPELVSRSSTIDVIWINERRMPNSFFEIEYSGDIQNSLIKFNDLQDFYTKMYIVADKARKAEFDKKLNYSVFRDINKRVKFLDYVSLTKLYEITVETAALEIML
jgi:hypothetical protein